MERNTVSLLKLHNVIVLSAFFSKTAPPILMKLCMYSGYTQGKVLVPLAPLVIALYKRKAAEGRFRMRVYVKVKKWTERLVHWLNVYI